MILAAPTTEQSGLVDVMASWAREVARDPLFIRFAQNKNTKHEDDDAEGREGKEDTLRGGV